MKFWSLIPVCLALTACNVLPTKAPVAFYEPSNEYPRAAETRAVEWRLSVSKPLATGPLASPRILIKPSREEIQVFPGAQWSESAPVMIVTSILHAIEADGRVSRLDRTSSGLGRDFELITELRALHIEASEQPKAVFRLKANLVAYPEGRVVATRMFEETQVATSLEVRDGVEALDEALSRGLAALASWSVEEGERHFSAKDTLF